MQLNGITLNGKSILPELYLYIQLGFSDVSTRATRHSRKTFYYLWYNRKTEGGRTFIAKAVKLWNSLPDKLKDCPNVKSFMRAYTSHFAAMKADLDHFTVN